MMRHLTRGLVWVAGVWAAGGLAGIVTPARGEAEVFLEVRASDLFFVPIVVEDFLRDPAGDPGAAGLGALRFGADQDVEDVLVSDLVNLDAFQVIRERRGEPRTPGLRIDVRGQLVDRPVQARVRGQLEWHRDELRLEATLLDEGSGERVFRERYVVARRAGGALRADRWGIHRFADTITRYLTGVSGCAATRIAFIREIGGAKELFLIDWDGHALEQVTGLGSILVAPAWQPSGERIAFTSYHHGRPELMALDLSTRRLATLARGRTSAAVAYAPDGKRIVYSSTETGDAELYMASAVGGKPRRVTFHPGIDTAPSWAPSGKRIVFASDRAGAVQLYLIDADGSNLEQLTFGGEWNDSPDWSPAGNRIVHVCRIEGEFEIALIRVDGGGWRRLTIGGGCENPRWAPDGRHVVFSRQQAGVRNLWVIDVDSANLRQLTAATAQTYNPAWSALAVERIHAVQP